MRTQERGLSSGTKEQKDVANYLARSLARKEKR